MQEYIKYNLHRYFYQDSKKYTFLWIVPICLFLLLILFAHKQNVYDVQEVKGQTICEEKCTINFFYPANSFLYEFIKVNRTKYDVDHINFSDPILDSQNNVLQNITLSLKNYEGNNNEFVELKIYKNKESLLKKVIKIIKER